VKIAIARASYLQGFFKNRPSDFWHPASTGLLNQGQEHSLIAYELVLRAAGTLQLVL
jgi:hypothetical protein